MRAVIVPDHTPCTCRYLEGNALASLPTNIFAGLAKLGSLYGPSPTGALGVNLIVSLRPVQISGPKRTGDAFERYF